jgi:trk system potassium uptake protein TrkA
MHVIVVGCGRVGSELAVTLTAMGHSVAILDKNSGAFRRLPEDWPGRAIVGYGYDRDHLEEAGVREADALAAVTSGDNSNVLTARIVREYYGIANVVARIYDPRRAVIYQRLGIPTVATVPWTTDQVLRRLFPDRSSTQWTDATATLVMVERGLPASWAGRSLAPMSDGDRFQLVAVARAGQAVLASSDLVGQEGDIVTFLVRRGSEADLAARLAMAEPVGGHAR